MGFRLIGLSAFLASVLIIVTSAHAGSGAITVLGEGGIEFPDGSVQSKSATLPGCTEGGVLVYSSGGWYCGTVMPVSNGAASCVSNNCSISACLQGYGNCDGNAENGCESDLTSVTNCGTCGNDCTALLGLPHVGFASCSNGGCVVNCSGTWIDLDLNLQNGCEFDTAGFISSLVINEIDYDQSGTPDAGEFVEIYNPTPDPIDLAGMALVFVNGSDYSEYSRVVLSDAGTLNPGQYLVVANSSVTVSAGVSVIRFGPFSDNIQNGAPDGVALIYTPAGLLIDALSYEGAITSAQITGIPGVRDLVEGTMLPTGTSDSPPSVNGSLCRIPNGSDVNDSAGDWAFCVTPTPGAPNQL
jgi:hypothetical protein